jgi:glycosyltransferase involved in cell wall biosynthesis
MGQARREARRPLRIGIDVTAAITQGGGIGRFTRELVRALVASDPENNYRLFSARPPALAPVPDPLPEVPNVKHCPAIVGERWLHRLWYRLSLPLPVQWVTGPLDLFHSPDFVLPPVARRVPTLLTVHDLSFVHYPETFPASLVAYLKRAVPRSVARSTHVLADSISTKEDLMGLWGVEEDKITVLYGGVDSQFKPVPETAQREATLAKYGLAGEPYLLNVGTIQPRKNLRMLIRAFKPIAAKWPHKLVIAGGKGWLEDEILAEAGRQGLSHRVMFPGYVADKDLPVLYSGSALFVFPSLYEGFGLPLLEAMACGVPVITSNASSLPEVAVTMGGAEAAHQLAPEDQAAWSMAIDSLLGDPERRAELVATGFRQASRFTWMAAATKVGRLYRRLAEPVREHGRLVP